MTPGRLAVAVISAVVLAGVAQSAAAEAVRTEYDVRYGLLTVMELRATTELGAGHYRTTAEMETVGVVALLFPWHATAITDGRRDEIGLHPLWHRTRGEYRDQKRSVSLDYVTGGTVLSVIDPPPDGDYRDAVPVALQQETVDPLTATLSALAAHCRGSVRVFDGRRRYDLQLVDLGDAEVPRSRRMAYTGRARRCRGDVKPLAGFWRSEPRHDERPGHIEYWIAAPGPDLPLVPVYLELSNHRGTLTVHLTSAAAVPAALIAPK
jgi:hypothetical protein